MGSTANVYCEKLGIPVPRLEDAMTRPGIKLFHLMVVALIEHGEPLELREIAVRLESAGVSSPAGDLVLSLKKAWHGKEPVYRLPDGRYGLVLGSAELEHILWSTGGRNPSPQPPLPELPPEPPLPADDAPLGPEELAEALRARRLPRLSELRLAAAVLEASGRPMTVAEMNAELGRSGGSELRLCIKNTKYWAGRLLSVGTDDRMRLQPGAPEMRQVRHTVRETLRFVRRERALQEQREAAWKVLQTVREEEERRAARVAEGLRRAVLRVLPDPRSPHAVAVLDESARSIRTFMGPEIGRVSRVLAEFDLIAGLHVRDTLHALGLEPGGWRLVDLKPPQKTRRLNRSGRLLHVTPELLISGTTGISRPFGDPAKVAAYLESGVASTRLRRRLESDVKALHAFHRYGVLHGCVRLRWGFLDETLPVDWAQPGEPHLRKILRGAAQTGTTVELVVGAAPGWREPWSRGRRARVLEVGTWDIDCALEGDLEPVDLRDVQAVRLAGGPSKGNSGGTS